MSVGFDEALRIAKERIQLITDESEPKVLRSEQQEVFFFKLGTSKGVFDVLVERDGTVSGFARESSLGVAPETRMTGEGERFPTGPTISREEAEEKALCYVGEGAVLSADLKHGVWQVEVDAGPGKGVVAIDIDPDGVVAACKQSRLTPVIDIE